MSKTAFFISELPENFQNNFFLNKILKNTWKIWIEGKNTPEKKTLFYDKNYRKIKTLPKFVKKIEILLKKEGCKKRVFQPLTNCKLHIDYYSKLLMLQLLVEFSC